MLSPDIDLDDPENPIYIPNSFFMGVDGLQFFLKNGKYNAFKAMQYIGCTENEIKHQL
jgi:hypothetical protein